MTTIERATASGQRRGLPRKFHRAEIERRFAPKKLDIAIDRFELNPGKSDIVSVSERACGGVSLTVVFVASRTEKQE